jgi:hypothetical protein
MIRRLLALAVFAAALIGPNAVHATSGLRQTSASPDHVAWVAEALKRMQTIQPGMTREDLLKVFTTEGGQSSRLQSTFVSQDCPYFKVDVQFAAVGQPNRDRSGQVTVVEGNQDIIIKISRPSLQFSVLD